MTLMGAFMGWSLLSGGEARKQSVEQKD